MQSVLSTVGFSLGRVRLHELMSSHEFPTFYPIQDFKLELTSLHYAWPHLSKMARRYAKIGVDLLKLGAPKACGARQPMNNLVHDMFLT